MSRVLTCITVVMAVLTVAALMPLPTSSAAEPTALRATYHIERSEQYYVFEPLQADIVPDGGKPFSGSGVNVKFTCPLGYVGASSEENRSYLDQVVHKITVKIDGREAPFRKTAVPGEKEFWCLDKELLRGGEIVAIRFTPPAGSTKPVRVRVELLLTRIARAPVEGAAETGEPRVTLSPKSAENYRSLNVQGFRIDPPRLKTFFAANGLSWSPEQPARDGIERFARFFATRAKYSLGVPSENDLNAFFEKPIGACNPQATGYVMGRRTQGVIARKIGGRNRGGDAGHAMAQEYDPQLGTFLSVDPSYYAGGWADHAVSYFKQVGRSPNREFIAFQDDQNCEITDAVPGEEPRRIQGFGNQCGRWYVFSDGGKIAHPWPTCDQPAAFFERIGTASRYFVSAQDASRLQAAIPKP